MILNIRKDNQGTFRANFLHWSRQSLPNGAYVKLTEDQTRGKVNANKLFLQIH